MSTSRFRRFAVVGALALGALTAFSAIAPAQAVTQPGNIDPDVTRSLTIHKFALGPESPQQIGTGQQVNVPGTPLAGAEFTASLVTGIDLLTPAGWSQAAALTPATAANRLSATEVFVATTAANGIALFPSDNSMPIGLYLVTETELPEGATNPSAPFLVTLPFPTGSTGSPSNQWIYDVHVYPKNSVTDLTKTRVPAAPGSTEARNPDLVRWAISAGIPTLAAGDAIDTFTITDSLPTQLEYLATAPTGVAPGSVTVTNPAGLPQNFVAGTDYTLTVDPAAATVSVSFTAAGRTRLSGLQGGAVTLTVLTRAVEIPANGLIVNTATSVVNGATETVTGTTPIGQLTVYSFQDEGGVRTPLQGSVYQVFLTENDARLGQNPVSIDGITNWTTGIDGFVEIPIMTPGTYFVREITPPAGFQLPTPSQVATQVVAGPSSVSAPVQNYVEFEHNQVPAWALPLTGGDAGMWFGVGGGALVAIALGAATLVARRRTELARAAA